MSRARMSFPAPVGPTMRTEQSADAACFANPSALRRASECATNLQELVINPLLILHDGNSCCLTAPASTGIWQHIVSRARASGRAPPSMRRSSHLDGGLQGTRD